jgi:hypothetical protein
MFITKSLRRLALKGLAVALASATFAVSHASFSAVVNWQRVFNTSNWDDEGSIDVDAGGNTYLWYKTVGATDQYRLSRISPTGAVYLGSYVSFASDSDQDGPYVAPDHYVYVGVHIFGANGKESFWIGKYGTGLNLIWSRTFTDPTLTWSQLTTDVDASGTVSIAFDHTTAPNAHELTMVQLSSGNALLSTVSNADIDPVEAVHVYKSWDAAGKMNGPVAGRRWGVYNQTTGADIGGQTMATTVVGTTTTTPIPGVYPTPDGRILVVVDTRVTKPNTTPVETSTLSLYSATAVHQWTTPTQSGQMIFPQTLGANQTIYVTSQLGTQNRIQLFTPAGVQTAIKNVPFEVFLVDPQGMFTYTNGDTSGVVSVSRYDLNVTIPAQWTYNYPASPDPGNQNSLSSGIYRGGTLYLAVETFSTTTNYNVDVRRFIAGVTLASLAPSTVSTVKSGGGTIALKATLTGAAPAGGLLVTFSSPSPKLLFSNNTQTISVAIAAGSIYAIPTLHTSGTVSANTPVTVTATQNGVAKTTIVTITP